MKISHKISMTESNKDMLNSFKETGISSEDLGGLWVFDVAEDSPQWETVKNLIRRYNLRHSVFTTFSSAEKAKAKYLKISPSWHHGYPQPEEDFAYLPIIYNMENYCSQCGSGLKQVAPFRMKKEPAWGKKSILQLNWEFDQYFVKPEVWENVFKPFGIKSCPVLNHKTEKILETVVQLEVTVKLDLDLKDAAYEECSRCGRKKYLPITRGWYPPPIEAPLSALFKSNQYFGSGGNAFHSILVSNELYLSIQKRKIKGVEFKACGDFG